MTKTGVLFIFSQIFLVVVLLSSCGVDPRWGPPRSGLRENMAWQYESAMAAPPSAPVSMMRSEPTFPAPMMTISPEPAPLVFSGDKKVQLVRGYAVTPAHAPEVVKRSVAAGNRMQRYPYKFGGGHAQVDTGGAPKSNGPRWKVQKRSSSGFQARHPSGL